MVEGVLDRYPLGGIESEQLLHEVEELSIDGIRGWDDFLQKMRQHVVRVIFVGRDEPAGYDRNEHPSCFAWMPWALASRVCSPL